MSKISESRFLKQTIRDDRIVHESGTRVCIGIVSTEDRQVDFEDRDTGKVKMVGVLRLTCDYFNGEHMKVYYDVSSKRLAQRLQEIEEHGDLYTKLIYISKTGEGYKTRYVAVAGEDKPKPTEQAKLGG